MTDAPQPIPARPRRWPWLALIAALIIGYVINALAAVSGKCATYDEPVHTLSSYLIVNHGDFRINPEHPALWKYVAGIGLWGQPLKLDLSTLESRAVFERLETQWHWTVSVMYRDLTAPRLYGEQLIWRARIAMTVFPVLLAILVARWAWAWSGPIAATVAVALLAFDPNFLAHGALVTNDVAASFAIALATYATWRLGERFTWKRSIAFMLTCAVALGIKYTCILLAPMLGIPLVWRALDPSPWETARRVIRGRLARLGLVIGISVSALLVGWLALWPMYQFRNAPTSAGDRFGDQYVRDLLAYNALIYERRNDPDPAVHTNERLFADVPSYRPSVAARAMLWINHARLVPQAWGYGINYANARSFTRASFLNDRYSNHGFWNFFPLAILYKTSMMTLAIALVSAVAGLSLAVRRIGDPAARWKLVCLIIPPILYFAIAMNSTLNIGLRHVLPVYVPVFVASGVMTARLVRHWRAARGVLAGALCLLAVETLSVFPNYIPFFNLASGGARGGLKLLSDSNLDWGQDLPALAEWYRGWRAANPELPFYLAYYATAEPRAFGIDFINTQPGYAFDSRPATFDTNGGVLAISASFLQGIYPEEMRGAMRELREKHKPLAVINDTIYIYDLGPVKPMPSTPAAP